MRIKQIILVAAAIAGFSSVAAQAATNLVKNGDFETVSGYGKFESKFSDSLTVANWTADGYNFIFNNSTNGAGGVSLWSPTNGGISTSGAKSLTSPTGGNFFAGDTNYFPGKLEQSISNLTVGGTYSLTFSYAAAQQVIGRKADDDMYWTVGLGTQTHTTTAINNVGKGFSGWYTTTMTFTADKSTELLSFLASGAPTGAPPFMLLDGVSMVAAVPEPETYAMMLGGLGMVGFAAARRRKANKANKSA